MTEIEAARITSIPYTVSAIVSPLCGILCDITGLNLIWTIVATIMSAGCHVAFSYLPISVIPPAVIMVRSDFLETLAFIVADLVSRAIPVRTIARD